MIRIRSRTLAALVVAAALSAAVSTSLACAHPTPASVTTPQGKVAYQSEDALDAIGALQHAAIAARRTNTIATPLMRSIVKATMAAALSINTAIDNGTGLQAAYQDASDVLGRIHRQLPAAAAQKFSVEFTAAQTVLMALQAAQGGA